MPSQVIRRFRYDAEAQRLAILFTSGRAYAYAGVPPAIAQEMTLAFSKGSFFNRKIRDRFPATSLGDGLDDLPVEGGGP